MWQAPNSPDLTHFRHFFCRAAFRSSVVLSNVDTKMLLAAMLDRDRKKHGAAYQPPTNLKKALDYVQRFAAIKEGQGDTADQIRKCVICTSPSSIIPVPNMPAGCCSNCHTCFIAQHRHRECNSAVSPFAASLHSRFTVHGSVLCEHQAAPNLHSCRRDSSTYNTAASVIDMLRVPEGCSSSSLYA